MKNLYSDTLQEYIEKERLIWVSEPELKDQPFDPIMLNIKGEHYAKVCEHCKNGGTITKEVYNSIDSLNQYHFTKHYNHRGNHF